MADTENRCICKIVVKKLIPILREFDLIHIDFFFLSNHFSMTYTTKLHLNIVKN